MAEYRTSGFRHGDRVSVSDLTPLDAIKASAIWRYIRQRNRHGDIEHLVMPDSEWPGGQQIPFRFCAARCEEAEEESAKEFLYGDHVVVSDSSQELADRKTGEVHRYVAYAPGRRHPHLTIVDKSWPHGTIMGYKFCTALEVNIQDRNRKLLLQLYASGKPYVVRDATSDDGAKPWHPIAWALTLRPPLPEQVEVAQVRKDGTIGTVADLW